MLKGLLNTFLRTAVRTSTNVQIRKSMNHGDTRWECQCCGDIKPKVAKKYDSDEGVICLKCYKLK